METYDILALYLSSKSKRRGTRVVQNVYQKSLKIFEPLQLRRCCSGLTMMHDSVIEPDAISDYDC